MASQYYDDPLTGIEHHKRSGEPSNRQRADWAGDALESFRAEIMPYEDDYTTLQDFLADLMHWARIRRVDFEKALSNARDCVEIEREQERPEPRDKKKRAARARRLRGS